LLDGWTDGYGEEQNRASKGSRRSGRLRGVIPRSSAFGESASCDCAHLVSVDGRREGRVVAPNEPSVVSSNAPGRESERIRTSVVSGEHASSARAPEEAAESGGRVECFVVTSDDVPVVVRPVVWPLRSASEPRSWLVGVTRDCDATCR
jgi:hypothetical protein